MSMVHFLSLKRSTDSNLSFYFHWHLNGARLFLLCSSVRSSWRMEAGCKKIDLSIKGSTVHQNNSRQGCSNTWRHGLKWILQVVLSPAKLAEHTTSENNHSQRFHISPYVRRRLLQYSICVWVGWLVVRCKVQHTVTSNIMSSSFHSNSITYFESPWWMEVQHSFVSTNSRSVFSC